MPFIRLMVVFMIMLPLIGCSAAPSYKHIALYEREINIYYKNLTLLNSIALGTVTSTVMHKHTPSPSDVIMNLDRDIFRAALSESLRVIGYRARHENTAPYRLDVVIRTYRRFHPTAGVSQRVYMKIDYLLHKDGLLWSFPIRSQGTANMSDKLVGLSRLRLAQERAIRANFMIFLRTITEQVKP